MKSSARNQLVGKVTAIEEEGGNCLVTVAADSGIEIRAQISSFSRRRLKLETGCAVAAMIKAASIVVAADVEPMVLSAENCLPGRVVQVEQGAVNSLVALDVGGHSLCAAITLCSSETPALEPGKPVAAVFNANQVMLGVLV